jgi:folate-dependent phosphoribosylglycinamide formyltransferase PurN
MKNIVVLISGNGSNLQAIIDACKQKKINGTIRAVFSNKADAFGLERARKPTFPRTRWKPASSPGVKPLTANWCKRLMPTRRMWWCWRAICVF